MDKKTELEVHLIYLTKALAFLERVYNDRTRITEVGRVISDPVSDAMSLIEDEIQRVAMELENEKTE